MKTIKKMAIIALLATMPAAAMAQEALLQAIDKFVKGKSADTYITLDNYESEEDTATGLNAYYQSYEFSINKTDSKFQQLLNAFKNTSCRYYSKYTKNAGTKDETGKAVTFDLRGSKRIEFGKRKERNYILYFVRDDQHPKWRTCCALVWYESPSADYKYSGSVHVVYSPDPTKLPRSYTYKAVTIPSNTIDMSGFDESMEKLDESMKKLDESLGKLDGLDGDTKVYYYDNSDKPTTADEFLNRFGTLRSMYVSAEKNHNSLSWRTRLVNRIVSLCRNGKTLLSADEKSVVVAELKKMQKESTDDYLKDILGVAAKALN